MSGNIDDLNFELNVDMEASLRSMRQMVSTIDAATLSFREVQPTAQRLADSVKQISFASTAAGADSLYAVASAADRTAAAMDTVATAVEAVEHSVTAVAFSAQSASTTLNVFGKALAGVRLAGAGIAGLGSVLRQTAGGMLHVAHSVHAVAIVVDLLQTAFTMLMAPLKAVWYMAVTAFRAIAVALDTVLLPVRMVWAGFTLLAKALWSVLSPLLSLTVTVAKVWFVFKGWIGALKLIGTWLAMLPPKVRLVVGGLLALGASGKVGATGMAVLANGVRAAATAAAVAVNSFRLLALPIQLLTNPAAAARNAMLLLGTAASVAGRVALSVTGQLYGLAAATGRLALSPLRMAADGFKSLGASLVRIGPQMAAIGATAAVALGVNAAMAAEKNRAVFGVMLKDMEQGKAVVASLQDSAAVGLFDNDEVLNSGRLLFKAGVAAVDLRGKTEQLATIAAATSTELADLTRIYQQGANRGSFGQDKINQMAERGIDIYHALEATTGKSGAALADMISGGKISITEMDAALAHLTEGNGIYAGSLETLGDTTSGMLARIKANFMQALGGLGGAGTEAFKPVLASILTMSEGIKTSMASVSPVVVQVFATIKAVFTGIWSVISGVFTAIFGTAQASFGGILQTVMDWATKFRWYFENLWPLTQFVWTQIALGAETMFSDIGYWLTDKLPVYAQWFGENFLNILTDIDTATATVFMNIGTNIKAAMVAIWDYIKSGGTADLEIAWTPLLEGFESTVSELPDVPDRAMTALEQSLQTRTEELGAQLADSFDKLSMEANAALNLKPPDMPAINPDLQSGSGGDGGDGAGAGVGGSNRSSFVVDSLQRGSQEALNAIFAGQKDNTPQKQLSEQKIGNKHLAKIASRPEPVVLGAT